ncbi:MAG: hypothetical protein JWM04_2404 [Verrucomicrobiales bacterium]|nr:hypothetical protein [Verrucomicrobiales bacterium]
MKSVKTEIQLPLRSEFYFSNPENCIVVENRPDHVHIRALRDNFSGKRRRYFIRHLIAEGFIAEPSCYGMASGNASACKIRWVVGPRRTRASRQTRNRLVRNVLRLLLLVLTGSAGVLGAVLLW